MIVPMTAAHLATLSLQPAQQLFSEIVRQPAYVQSLIDGGPAYALVDGDEVFATAGLLPQWEGRAVAWALVSEAAGRRMVELHRAVLRCFEMHPFRRVETTVATHFEEGHRWARLLGFEREGTMRGYAPNGTDCDLYARVI